MYYLNNAMRNKGETCKDGWWAFALSVLQLLCKLDGIWQHICYMQLTEVSWIS